METYRQRFVKAGQAGIVMAINLMEQNEQVGIPPQKDGKQIADHLSTIVETNYPNFRPFEEPSVETLAEAIKTIGELCMTQLKASFCEELAYYLGFFTVAFPEKPPGAQMSVLAQTLFQVNPDGSPKV